MSLGKSKFIQFKLSVNQDTSDLYDEMVHRQDSLRQALTTYVLIENKKTTDDIKHETYRSIRESILWFMTVEFYSRFLSDFTKRTHSKRCLSKLVDSVDSQEIKAKFDDFLVTENELINYISIQRKKYFAHADEISWNEFPRTSPEEFQRLLDRVAGILNEIGTEIGSQRICSMSRQARV